MTIGGVEIAANQAGQARDIVEGLRLPQGEVGPLRASSSDAVFNISISIHDSPAGDDDSTTNAGASDKEQRNYEDTIKFFADGVCEQTNGVHKIGKVRIFKDGEFGPTVDVKWDASGGPAAHTTGFGKAGWQIFFFDKFPGGAIDANGNFTGGTLDIDSSASDREMMGYILAHEWGHYALGVYDEYQGNAATGTRPSQPISSDVATDKAIMSRERVAANGDFSWLNHSTSNNIGDLTKTAQGRTYGKSGWDTLIQTTNNDPTTVSGWAKPTRTHYTNLVGQQPTASDNWYKIQLPAGRTGCRDQLDIQWIENLEIDVVLDRSGSMQGTSIANAISAAQSLVDIVPGDTTALGVSSFNSFVSSNAAITAIPDPGTSERTTLKNAIGTITATGTTAMFDGAVFGLDKIEAYAAANNTSAAKLVFLLSDGGDNASSETQSTTISKFNAAGASIIAFGYGSNFDSRLVALANGTGGRFVQSPTTAAQIQAAFAQSFAAVSSAEQLASELESTASGATTTTDFVIDETIAALTVTVSYSGSASDTTITLLDDAGADTGQTFVCSGSVSCLLTLDEAAVTALGNGTYTVSVENTSSFDISNAVNVVSTPKSGFTYSLKVNSQSGTQVTYPAPIIISAVISRDLPIAGATVQATITDPFNVETTVDMNDDGVGADQFADDGVYSAWGTYTSNGTYTIDVTASNPSGSAVYTYGALSQVHGAAGDTDINVPALSNANFQRNSQLQVTVAGVLSDDHSSTPSFPATCTLINGDNIGVDGKIDSAGDVDCFQVNPSTLPSGDLTVRVFNQASGSDAKFTVYDNTGSNVIAEVDPASKAPSDGALFETIAQADVDPAGVVIAVSDVDSAAAGGTYSVGAGEALVSDVASGTSPVVTPVTDGGGGLGPWGLLAMLFLGLGRLAMRGRSGSA
ncbi:MAG: VWA domain-containing protein [Pseudomonadota bacterium]